MIFSFPLFLKYEIHDTPFFHLVTNAVMDVSSRHVPKPGPGMETISHLSFALKVEQEIRNRLETYLRGIDEGE